MLVHKMLLAFLGPILLLVSSNAGAVEFSCPVPSSRANLTCSGTVRVKTLAELNTYKETLGIVAKKPTIAKNLLIEFNPELANDLIISTPCQVRIAENTTLNTSKNICINGERGVFVDAGFIFNGKNLELESREEVVIRENSNIKALDIKLISLGAGDTSKAYLKEGAIVEAQNLLITSYDKGFVGRNSNVKLSGALSLFTLGDDEASVRVGASVEAAKIEIASTEVTRIANLVNLKANEIILNGRSCIVNKNAVVTAVDRIGNCFLQSNTKAKFTIDKNQGTSPLTVNFNGSTIVDAKGFIWSFGDGETSQSLDAIVAHTYTRPGIYSATLKYATKDNFKGLKSAGSVQIDVKAPVVETPTTPPEGSFNYYQEYSGTFLYLRSFIKRTQFDIASAYYVVDDNFDNKIVITNFYANAQANVDLQTVGQHKVTMYVEDVRGQKFNTTQFVDLKVNAWTIAPVVRFYGVQSARNTAFINMSSSFLPLQVEFFKTFYVQFGDGQEQLVDGATTVTHTYAQPGTYNVTVSSEYMGNRSSLVLPVTVTDTDKPAINPDAGFEYYILDFVAGHVTFADDRSGTPNGEIISYEWDFGDNTISYGKKIAHFFAPGEYLVKLTVTDTAGLRSSQTQKIKISTAGDDLVAALNCYSDYTKRLDCNIFAVDKSNQITRVKMEWGDGSSELITDAYIIEWGLYFGSHTYQNYGEYRVKLTADTARGETKYAYFNQVFAAKAPVADIYCYTNNLLVSCNALGSYDPQGSSLSYIFDYGDGFIESNESGISTHAYSASGFYDVKVRVVNSFGVSSEAVTSVQPLLPQNIIPIANLNCYSSVPFVINCSAAGSFDRDGYVVMATYTFADGTVLTSDPSSTVTHHLAIGGEQNVSVVVTDNDGGNSLDSTQNFNVMSNYLPIAYMQCFTNQNKISCNSLMSYDRDGSIISSLWQFGDGTTATGSFVEHTYSGFGHYTVSLNVVDDKFAIGSETQVIPVQGLLPFAIGSCSTNGRELSCDGSQSYDIDGTIIQYKWIINDEVELVGKNTIYNFTTSGTKKVYLEVSDNHNNSSRSLIETFSIDAEPPVAYPICYDADPRFLQCEGGDSSSGGRIVSYKWTLNGQTFDGVNQTFLISEDGIYNVSLTVEDELGMKDTRAYSYEMFPSTKKNESLGYLNLTTPESGPFYALVSNLVFEAVGATLSENISSNEFTLNNSTIDSSLITYNFQDNTVSLNVQLTDGENKLSFVVLDIDNKKISYEKTIYAGSKNVSISIYDESNSDINNVKLRLISSTDDKEEFLLNLTSSQTVISNVPRKDFFVRTSKDQLIGTSFVFSDNSNIIVKMHNYDNDTVDNNNDFSNGVSGWELFDTPYELSENGLMIEPNSEGRATLRQTGTAVFGNSFIGFPFSVTSNNENDYVFISLRNKNTGEVVEKMYRTGDEGKLDTNGNFLLNNFSFYTSIKATNASDVIEVEANIYSKTTYESTTYLNKALGYLLPVSVANTESLGTIVTAKGKLAGQKVGKVKLTKMNKLMEKQEKGIKPPWKLTPNYEELRYISISPYPTYYDQNGNATDFMKPFPETRNGKVITVNRMRFSIPTGLELSEIDSIQLVQKFPLQLNCEEVKYVEADKRSFSKNDGNIQGVFVSTDNDVVNCQPRPISASSIKLSIKIKLKNNNEILIPISDNFPILASLTNNLIRGNPGDRFGSDRFGPKRDLARGGDDWYNPALNSVFIYLLNLNDSFFNTDGPPTPGSHIFLPLKTRIRVNDISLMNGGQYQGTNVLEVNGATVEELTVQHESHQLGTSVDLLFAEYLEEGGTVAPKKLKVTAEKLITILEDTILREHILTMLVTYEKKSAFEEAINQTCLSNGYLANELLVQHRGHADHFHLNLSASSLKRRFLSKRDLRLCSKLNHDSTAFELKSCEFPEQPVVPAVSNSNLYVVGRRAGSSDRYQEFTRKEKDFKIPDNLKGSKLEVMVIDKANDGDKTYSLKSRVFRTMGCGKQIIQVDARPVNFLNSCKDKNKFVETFGNEHSTLAIDESCNFNKDIIYSLNNNNSSNVGVTFACDGSKINSYFSHLNSIISGSIINGGGNIENTTVVNSLLTSSGFGFGDVKNSKILSSKIEKNSHLNNSTVSFSIISNSDLSRYSVSVVMNNVTNSTIVDSSLVESNVHYSFLNSSSATSSDILNSSLAHSSIDRTRVEGSSILRESSIRNGLHLISSTLIRSKIDGHVSEYEDINARSMLLKSNLTCSSYSATKSTSFLDINFEDCAWYDYPIQSLKCQEIYYSCDTNNVKKGLEELYPYLTPGWE